MHPIDFAEQARVLVRQMTQQERVSVLSGSTFWDLQPVDRLGLDTIKVSDGPHGMRRQDTSQGTVLGLTDSLPATCFPTSVTMASSWDDALVRDVGEAIAVEAKAQGVSVVLGPGVNIKRSPLCGRNFEYFSEDPFLSGRLAVAFINGVQAQGIGTSIKHFAVNNQEDNRMVIDTLVDERTMREIYFPAFEMAVKQSQPWTVMHAYNRVNGVYCGENRWLLDQVLRQEWGFEGLLVSDWGATNSRAHAVRAGMDLEMPSSGGAHDGKLLAGLKSGAIPQVDLDRCAHRVVELTLAGNATKASGEIDFDAHEAMAQRAAAEGAVLLKNYRALLPFNPKKKLAVIGGFAEKPRFQGAGSSQVNAAKVDTPLDRIRAYVEERGGRVTYAQGFDPDLATADPALIAEAVEVAAQADIVLVLGGLPALFESEGFDRTHLDMPDQINQLISAVAAANTRTAVALSNGSPVTMPWLDEVRAVLELYLTGQAGAGALTDLVFGEVCPSGKLAETFPLELDHVPAQVDFGETARRVVYREGLNVGYRYFTTYDKPVLFPFGFGLSYTRFGYGKAKLDVPAANLSKPVRVTVPITNKGKVAGAEIVQVYVRQRGASVFRPDRELKGYAKVRLAPGETSEVVIELDKRAFSFWDNDAKKWRVEPTEFDILIGESATTIHRTLSFTAQGDEGYNMREAFSAVQPVTMDDAQLSALGLTVTPVESSRPFHRNSTLSDIRNHWLGKRVYAQAQTQMRAILNPDDNPVLEKMGESFLNHLPLRTLQTMSQGALTDSRLDTMIAVMNGHWIKVLRGFLKR